jgi:hypothetical protein
VSLRKHSDSGQSADVEAAPRREPEDAPLLRRSAESLTPAGLLRVQRTLGNHAAGRLPARRRVLQRLTAPEALKAAVERGGVSADWYNRVFVPG